MGGMRYHVALPRGRALLAALTGHPVEVGPGAVRLMPGSRADGLRACCASRPGGGHLCDCIATPAIRAELTRQEKRMTGPPGLPAR